MVFDYEEFNMEERKNKIINYLILLQIYKYKIETVRKTFEKYGNLLGKKIEDCGRNSENSAHQWIVLLEVASCQCLHAYRKYASLWLEKDCICLLRLYMLPQDV